jgi:sugar phosphate isomerase/epimerase
VKILYVRGLWGMPHPTLESNLRQIKEGGFDAVEMGAPATTQERRELRAELERIGLGLVVQQWTRGSTPEEHIASFEEQLRRAVELAPLFVNSHTGKDHFPLRENLRVFREALRLAEGTGVRVLHETHRGRALYSLPSTMALLDALPALRLTADFSHWCCVHESLLEDQAESVARAVERSDHVHARVGHAEGAQVSDPRAPEWRDALEAHLAWWQAIVDRHVARGTEALTVCPEFGPPPYLPTLPYTRQPVADLWELNAAMRAMLRERLRA